MNCTEFEGILDDYVDGLLARERRRQGDEHLAACPGCRELVEEQRALLEATATLPRDIKPQRDLLPGIRAAVEAREPRAAGIEREPRKAAWTRWAGLAASLILVSIAAVIGLTLKNRSETPQIASRQPAADVRPAAQLALAEFREAERQYLEAVDLLLASIEQRRGQLSPQTRAALEKNLAIIDRAIAEVRAALEEDPGNAENGYLLTSMYRQKMELLWRVSRLSS